MLLLLFLCEDTVLYGKPDTLLFVCLDTSSLSTRIRSFLFARILSSRLTWYVPFCLWGYSPACLGGICSFLFARILSSRLTWYVLFCLWGYSPACLGGICSFLFARILSSRLTWYVPFCLWGYSPACLGGICSFLFERILSDVSKITAYAHVCLWVYCLISSRLCSCLFARTLLSVQHDQLLFFLVRTYTYVSLARYPLGLFVRVLTCLSRRICFYLFLKILSCLLWGCAPFWYQRITIS
jgi:hypothetical protein